MATVIRTVCDQHQAAGETVDASLRQVNHPLTGKPVEMDLCDPHWKDFTEALTYAVQVMDKYGQAPAAKPAAKQPRPPAGPPVQCPHCPETAATVTGLAAHARINHPDQLIACPVGNGCTSRMLDVAVHTKAQHKRWYSEEYPKWLAAQEAMGTSIRPLVRVQGAQLAAGATEQQEGT